MNFLPKVVIKRFGVNLAAVAFLFSTMSYGAPMGKVKFVDVDGVKTGSCGRRSTCCIRAVSAKQGIHSAIPVSRPQLIPKGLRH